MPNDEYLEETARALQEVSNSLRTVSFRIADLGVGNEYTEVGGMEAIAMKIRDGSASIAGSLDRVAQSLNNIADVLDPGLKP